MDINKLQTFLIYTEEEENGGILELDGALSWPVGGPPVGLGSG